MRLFLDFRHQWLRVAAWELGRMVRLIQGVRSAARTAWLTFGGQNALLNVMAACIITGFGAIAWWAFEPIVPLQSTDVLSIEPASRVVDRDHDDEFKVRRRICMRWGGWGHVTRSFVGAGRDGIEYRLGTVQPLFFPEGCHERERVVEIPPTLPPGQYIYRSVIQFCARRGCVDAAAQDLPIVVRGAWPLQPQGAPAPMREPF